MVVLVALGAGRALRCSNPRLVRPEGDAVPRPELGEGGPGGAGEELLGGTDGRWRGLQNLVWVGGSDR